MVDARKTYAELVIQDTVDDDDLLASFRGAGPLKQLTAATMLDYTKAPFALGSGAGLVATTRQEPGAVTRTVQSVLQDSVNPASFGAVGNGTANDTTAIEDADDSSGPLFLTRNYRIASDITLSSSVIFAGEGRLTIDSGVTVTFEKQPTAPDRQIFYGVGGVAGLSTSKAIWFAGDGEGSVAVDSQPRLQKAADASVIEGAVVFSSGDTYYINGATPITFSKGQRVVSEGSTAIGYTSRTSNVFRFTTVIHPELHGFDFFTTNPLWSTAGRVVDVDNCSYFKWSNLTIRNGWEGIRILNGVGHKGSNFEIFEAMNIGFGVQGVNDVFIDQFEISAPVDYFTVSTRTGTFTPGETLNVSGSPIGTFTENINSTTIKGYVFDTNPAPGATLTGASSGATALIVSQTTPYALGGIRLFGKVEAFIACDGDVIGGTYSMTTDGTAFGWTACPAFNRFTNVYFDSSDGGVILDKTINTDFIGCWWSNRPGNGMFIAECYNTTISGGEATNSWAAGIAVSANAVNTVITGGFKAVGNNVGGAGFPGIYFAGGCSNFTVTDCVFTDNLPFGTQTFGVTVGVGASDNYTIVNNIGTVSDDGTGVNKHVWYGTAGPKELSYVPTVTPSGGAFVGTPSREAFYTRDGGVIDITIRIFNIDPGTATGAINVNVPVAPTRSWVLPGKERAATGKAVTLSIPAGSSTGSIVYADGTSPIVLFGDIVISGQYRI